MPKITPFLWFDDQAEEAVAFYLSVFPNSRVLDVVQRGPGAPGPSGSVLTIRFELGGSEFLALNGGPDHYGFDEAISFVIDCSDQADVDYYWERLCDGGAEIACGWLRDRYGLRWQVVPSELPSILADRDPDRSRRAMEAMLAMTKLDLAAVKAAAAGERT